MLTSKLIRFDNSGYMFIGILLTALIGFTPSYFLSSEPTLFDFSSYIHFHAIMMGAWLLILVIQPFLIRLKRRKLHRLIGKMTYVFFPVLILSMLMLVHSSLHLTEGEVAGIEFYIPFKDLSVIVPCFVLAIIYRKNPLIHARFIVGSTIQLIEPALVRVMKVVLPASMGRGRYLVTLGIVYIVLFILIYRDRKQKKGRWVFCLVLGMVVTIHVGLFAGFHKTEMFMALMHWFMDLPLT